MSEFVVWKSKFKNTYNILSEDFTNDVSLEVAGDFKDEEEYKATAELICKKLNTTQQLTDENSKLENSLIDLGVINSNLTDELRELREVIKVCAQMEREVRHAQNQGPEWYTKGSSGLFIQVRHWLDKAREALVKQGG